MPYIIEKQFEVATSHRVYNQDLDFSMCSVGIKERKCRRIHGHTGVYIIRLASDALIKSMTLDFNEIGFIKNALDKYIDHHHMIYHQDPQFEFLVEDLYRKVVGDPNAQVQYNVVESLSAGEFEVKQINTSNIDNDNPYKALLEAYTVINFNSTSEVIAQWIYTVAQKRIDQFIEQHPEYIQSNLRVESVSYKESPKSMATYIP